MDNIFILSHLIDKELNGTGEKVNALFIDLKAALTGWTGVCYGRCWRREG